MDNYISAEDLDMETDWVLEGDFVAHYGTPHDGLTPHSGRYPWGSGEDSYQNSLSFKGMVADLKKQGLSGTELAKAMGMSTTQFRAWNSISKDEIRKHDILEIKKLKAKGLSDRMVAEKLGLSGESQVRSLMKQAEAGRADKTKEVCDVLTKNVDEKKYIQIGSGIENQLHVTQDKLKVAVSMAEEKGYRAVNIEVPQATNPKQKTTVKCLMKADKDVPVKDLKKELWEHRDEIKDITGYYEDRGDGVTIRGIEEPVPIDSRRVMIRYAEDKDRNGVKGVERDGVIQLRRGVEDLSLHDANYAQVRIDVDGTHYLKGMAVYGDDKDFPKGIDVIFNTNKHEGTPKMDVLKPLKIDKRTGEVDMTNPFGASIKTQDELILCQSHYKGKDGKWHQSALNIVNEEGNWKEWKKTIASQMLSKQPVKTADTQLKLKEKRSRLELDEIEALTNPVVKKRLLQSFADGADSDAVELKAAAFPRQASHVIIPINSLKPTEIYAPNYHNGEEVMLIRYPHAGTFEIPVLRVNNKNKEGREVLTPNARDAVGINHKVAEQLSGADFDGDTVLVIPTRGQNLKASKPIKSLVEFEPKEDYKAYEGMPKVGPKTGFQKQKQMGMVSNLITDMTIQHADTAEIVRAVKYSMVVIDAEKHNLNWRQANKDFNVEELKQKYQHGGGASTLISRASGEKRVPEVSDYYKIDPKTGKKVYRQTMDYKLDPTTHRPILDPSGKPIPIGPKTHEVIKKVKDENGKVIEYVHTGKRKENLTKTTQMAATDDAYTLSSGTQMENVYARYANSMKAMANEARKVYVNTPNPTRDPVARKKYAAEVASLQAKLDDAKSNAPRERAAQLIASKHIEMARKANPDLYEDKDELKKLRNQTIKGARHRTGADKHKVTFTPKEWEAVQNNAISATHLNDLLNNADLDEVKKLATPKAQNLKLTNSKIASIKAYAARGYDNAEIAKYLGVSTSTVSKYLNA